MAYYRCYFLGRDCGIAAAEDFEAPSDEEARARAEQLFQDRRHRSVGYELWSGSRRLHRHREG